MIRGKLLIIVCFCYTLGVSAQDTNIHVGRGSKTVINTHSAFTSFNVEMRGRIELTDDDKDVKSISSDGYLEIKKTVFGSKRTLKITPAQDGLNREYYEGRTKVAFEPDGRAWMAEILPELVRSTTIGAQGRVNRIYRQGGVSAVNDEIDRLQSNHVKSHYANLIVQKQLKNAEYAQVIDRVSRSISSNYYLSEFLKENLNTFIKSKETLDALFRATARIDSDHYKSEVIKAGLRNKSISDDAVKIILLAAGDMDSDHYKTEVLTSLMNQSLNDVVMIEIINTSKSIDSDHYRSVVLSKALEEKTLSDEAFDRSVESLTSIGSDHYKTEVLTKLLENSLPDAVVSRIIDLTKSIDSDHYTSEVLRTILETQRLNNENFGKLVSTAGDLESDHYTSTVMEIALSRELEPQKMKLLLKASSGIGSDHYLSEVLQTAAPMVREMTNDVKQAYRDTAAKIKSETYYGRSIRALDRP